MTRRKLSASEKIKGIPMCEIDLLPEVIRVAQRGEAYLRTIMDLLNARTEKPPFATVEEADLEVLFIITKIYIAHMPDSKINRQTESEAHKKLISRTFKIKVRW